MDEIIAHLHTATKSLYDRGQTVLQQATALATSAAARPTRPPAPRSTPQPTPSASRHAACMSTR
ncbi:MAG: hypothetical protein IPJ49_21470 [Candidatus Obscuribacter sp.]|nr:hypothetical protein [Candidatus Obscuribacter sp.]